jgi:hypothetical protein
MRSRFAAGAILGCAIALGAPEGGARAADPPVEPARARVGAVVVALGDDAAAAAAPLARTIYKEAALQPSIDDATARVLIGEPLPESPPAKLRDLAELRAGIPRSADDVASRRLLASIGADLGAAAVVVVSIEDGKPIARVIQVASASYEGVVITATVEPAPAATITWPGAVKVLTGILGASSASPRGAPTAAPRGKTAAGPRAPASKSSKSSKDVLSDAGPKKDSAIDLVKSPWFWGGLGAVATVGVTIFVIAKASEGDDNLLRLQGRVPQ